jgi:hypothetical protein
MVKCFWAKREAKYSGLIVGRGIVRTSPLKVATIKEVSLPEKKNLLSILLLIVCFIVNLLIALQIVRFRCRICLGNHFPGE